MQAKLDYWTQLFDYLATYKTLSEQDRSLIMANSDIVRLKSGEYFLSEGSRCMQIGFVCNGILRNFEWSRDGKEITHYFALPEHFAINMTSFNQGSNSEINIQAETACELITMTKPAIELFSKHIEKWDYMVKNIIESRLLLKTQQKTKMLNQDATERYLSFVKEYPEIIKVVPLNHIASYLGVTPYSLSRIRKKLAKSDLLPNGN